MSSLTSIEQKLFCFIDNNYIEHTALNNAINELKDKLESKQVVEVFTIKKNYIEEIDLIFNQKIKDYIDFVTSKKYNEILDTNSKDIDYKIKKNQELLKQNEALNGANNKTSLSINNKKDIVALNDVLVKDKKETHTKLGRLEDHMKNKVLIIHNDLIDKQTAFKRDTLVEFNNMMNKATELSENAESKIKTFISDHQQKKNEVDRTLNTLKKNEETLKAYFLQRAEDIEELKLKNNEITDNITRLDSFITNELKSIKSNQNNNNDILVLENHNNTANAAKIEDQFDINKLKEEISNEIRINLADTVNINYSSLKNEIMNETKTLLKDNSVLNNNDSDILNKVEINMNKKFAEINKHITDTNKLFCAKIEGWIKIQIQTALKDITKN